MKIIVAFYAATGAVGAAGSLVFMNKVSDPEEHWHPLNFILAVILGAAWPLLPLIAAGAWCMKKLFQIAPWTAGNLEEGAEDDDE